MSARYEMDGAGVLRGYNVRDELVYEDGHWSVMPDERPGIDVAGDVDPADVREIPADKLDVTTYPANFRASAAKLGASPHENTYRAGVRHGYLMAADAMDEMVAEIQRLQAEQHEMQCPSCNATIRSRLVDQTERAELVDLRERDEAAKAVVQWWKKQNFSAPPAEGASLLDELAQTHE